MSTDLGTFGTLFAVRREQKQAAEAATRKTATAARERNIEALERWHHVWRLTHDADYRELYAGEFEEKRRRLHAELAPDHHGLTVEERRAATRRMAQWGRGK